MEARRVWSALLVGLAVLSGPACGSRLSSGGGAGGSGGGLPPGSAELAAPPSLPGLLSAVAGTSSVRLEWYPVIEAGSALELALFQSTAKDLLYQSAPLASGLAGAALLVDGLSPGAKQYFGLAWRTAGTSDWNACGAVLSAEPGLVLYVDASADALLADGLTPATAFPSPQDALLLAFAFGGANVWCAGGEYDQQALVVFPGTRVFGGFAPGFALAERDTQTQPTRLRGYSNLPIVSASGDTTGRTLLLDGLELEGLGLASIGVDVADIGVELRRIQVRQSKSRGLRLRAAPNNDSHSAQLVGCALEENLAEGLSADGPWSLELQSSSFSGNLQEGCDLNDSVAPPGETLAIVVRDCLFFANGTDGFDSDLAVPLGTPDAFGTGGRFELRFEGSRFERNGGEGLQVDLDYETQPEWSASIVLDAVRARGNLLSGVHLDLDARADCALVACVASANRGDGFWISSESAAGLVTLSACASTNNFGAGVRVDQGQSSLSAGHCFLAGNEQGGIISPILPALLHSSALWLQALPYGPLDVHLANVEASDPEPALCVRAPRAYLHASGQSGAALVLEPAPPPGLLILGDRIELDDDARALSVVGGAFDSPQLDPAPLAISYPAPVGLFAGSASSVVEDYAPAPGSALMGSALSAPGAALLDAGPLGVALQPGLAAPSARAWLLLGSPQPALSQAVGTFDTLEIRFFGAALDSSSASSDALRVLDQQGQLLAVDVAATDSALWLAPALGGWPAGALRVELRAPLAGIEGESLPAPQVLIWSRD